MVRGQCRDPPCLCGPVVGGRACSDLLATFGSLRWDAIVRTPAAVLGTLTRQRSASSALSLRLAAGARSPLTCEVSGGWRQIRVPERLPGRPLRKIRPAGACLSRISMRRLAPDLRPCLEMSTTGWSSMAARKLSRSRSFLGRDEYETRSRGGLTGGCVSK
jgi:hypothetical protein